MRHRLMRPGIRLPMFLAILLSGPASAQLVAVPGHVGPLPRIVNGVLTSDFPTTGALLFGRDPGSAQLQCSGTLIGCQTFLTAGHCVAGDLTPTDYAVFLQHAGFFRVQSIALHPTYNFPVGDVAVLKLSTAVTGIPPTHINTTAAVAPGTPGVIAGFGRTGGSGSDYGLKRYGAVTTAACTTGISDVTSVCWDFTSPLGPPGSDSNTCNGDSGGPLFVDFGAGAVVAGSTSGGNSGDCLPTDVSFDANLFTYASYIQAQGGSDLASTTCGTIPQVGNPDAGVLAFGGTLTTSAPEGRHTVTIAPGMSRLRVAMNALDDGLTDFDLYVKFGNPPTTSDYDCRQNGAGEYGFCEFANPALGTWYILVSRFNGSGPYQVTATTFGTDCSDPANEGMACDDTNPCTAADACHAGTCTGTAVGNGTPCDDGSPCTTGDTCQAGACTGQVLPDGSACSDGDICTVGDRCVAGSCVPGAGPATGCRTPTIPARGTVQLRENALNSARDRLSWRWSSGAATAKADFGNPLASATFGLCVYDETGGVPQVIQRSIVPPGAHWIEGTSGYKYLDTTLAAGGIRSIVLKSGVAGRASVSVRGQGPGLALPVLPLTQQSQVIVQLIGDRACWEARYSTNVVNKTTQFKAKND